MQVERIAPDPADLDVPGTLSERLHGIGEVERQAVRHGSFSGNLDEMFNTLMLP